MKIRKNHNELESGDVIYATVDYEVFPMRAINQAFIVGVGGVVTDDEIDSVLRLAIVPQVIIRHIARQIQPAIYRSEK